MSLCSVPAFTPRCTRTTNTPAVSPTQGASLRFSSLHGEIWHLPLVKFNSLAIFRDQNQVGPAPQAPSGPSCRPEPIWRPGIGTPPPRAVMCRPPRCATEEVCGGWREEAQVGPEDEVVLAEAGLWPLLVAIPAEGDRGSHGCGVCRLERGPSWGGAGGWCRGDGHQDSGPAELLTSRGPEAELPRDTNRNPAWGVWGRAQQVAGTHGAPRASSWTPHCTAWACHHG